MILLKTLLFVLLLHSTPINCDDVEYKLIHSLLANYDNTIRPTSYYKQSINVTFGISLTQIIDVDERNMIITTNCWLTQDWIDSYMKWDPKEYNGINLIHVDVNKLWKPDVLLVNNADQFATISSLSTNLMVQNDGNVTWLSSVIFKSSCSINVRYFPFDEQVCELIFASWTFDMLRLNLDINTAEGDSTNYIKNGEWHLVKLIATRRLKKYSCCVELYPEVIYTLTIRRRPLFYVFNMVFPCLLITLVAFLGFYLPPDCSEKVSIGITTLLSITVFLMLVAESMPPTSEELPLLGLYYGITICIVTFSTAFGVLTLNINNKGRKGTVRPPRLVRKIFFKYLARLLRYELFNDKKTKLKNYRLYSVCNDKGDETHEFNLKRFSEASSPHTGRSQLSSILKYSDHIKDPKFQRNVDLDTDNLLSHKENSPLTTRKSSHPFNCHANNEPREPTNPSSRFESRETHSLNVRFIREVEKILKKQFQPFIANINKIQAQREKQKELETKREIIQNEWRDIAMISDQIICFTFSSMTIITCVFIFSNSPHIFPISEW